MANNYSSSAKRNLLATSAPADIVVALEIAHPDLVVPVRIVSDTENLTINMGGEEVEFIACPFDITLPDDIDQQIPKARLSVANIGRELTQWLEYSRGGKGAKARILQIMRSDGQIEFDMTLDMTGIKIDNLTVTSELGFQDVFRQPAVAVRYDPKTSPALW